MQLFKYDSRTPDARPRRDGQSNQLELTPLHRLWITYALNQEAEDAATAAWASRALNVAVCSFFWALVLLAGLLVYRKISEALDLCCQIPQLGVLQKAAGWLWAAEYVAPLIALTFACWWAVLLVLLWRTKAWMRYGFVGSFPFLAYLVRSSDPAVGTLIVFELTVQVMFAYFG